MLPLGRIARLAPRFAFLACSLLVLGPLAAAGGAGSPSETGIVDIDTNLAYEQAAAAGTGLVLTSSGEVLTNNHVIRGATSIRVIVPGSGKSFAARVVGYDLAADVAVLQLQGASGLGTVTTGDSASLGVGAAVTAIGNAGGLGGAPTVTTGKVVALRQAITVMDDSGGSERLQGLIQTNAPLQPGDSGGPLLNGAGQVVGMNTAASTGFQFQPGTSQGYSIPIDTALAIARQIETGQQSAGVHVGPTSFLGVDVESPDQGFGFGAGGGGSGALVVYVVPSSPADRVGLGQGDILTSLAGRKIATYNTITGVILGIVPGSKIEIGWQDQAGESHSARVEVVSGPPQ